MTITHPVKVSLRKGEELGKGGFVSGYLTISVYIRDLSPEYRVSRYGSRDRSCSGTKEVPGLFARQTTAPSTRSQNPQASLRASIYSEGVRLW